MSVAAENRGANDWTEVILTYDFEIEPPLALAWLTELIARPTTGVSPAEYAGMLSAYRDLAAACPNVPRERLPAQLPGRGRALLQSAMREATMRNPHWAEVDAPTSGYASRTDAATRFPTGLERLPDEFWQALVAETNRPGTISQALLLLDALVRSIPVGWIARMQGGKWELWDANANARKHARGKAGKAALKPRMVLRARGVRLPWKIPGAWVSNGAARVAAPGARTVAEGLKIAQANAMRMISKTAWSSLPGRGVLSGNAVGAALTLAPQVHADLRDTGLYSDPSNPEKWKNFAVAEAKGQSANLFGLFGGMLVGGVIVTAFGVTAAPAVIVVGLVAGAGMQAGFNAFGFADDVEGFARAAFGR